MNSLTAEQLDELKNVLDALDETHEHLIAFDTIQVNHADGQRLGLIYREPDSDVFKLYPREGS